MTSEMEESDLSLKGSSCVLEYQEKIVEMIGNLKISTEDTSAIEKAYEDFWQILSKFQNESHLLDGYLDRIVNDLVEVVMNPKSLKLRIEAFKYLHTVMKVRGYKRAVRYMSHEVSNLEPVVVMLESVDLELECWQASYVLLVWLSILVLTPFPMSYFDSPTAAGKHLQTMMTRIDSIIKKYLLSSDMFSVASYLVANFYTRVDVKEKMLSPFFSWIISVLVDKQGETIFKVAVLAGAAATFKRGEREELMEHARNLLVVLLEEPRDVDSKSLLYRKYRSKVVQRIGLTFLKKCKIKWRYEKGCCSLLQNLTGQVDPAPSTDSISLSNVEESSNEEEQFDEDVLESLTEVIDNLIHALEDPDTVVRWSAARGIGRITERLTQQMGEMVVTSVLDIFSERKNHFSWHGACLALAQMASRGLLPKPRLAEIVKHVFLALTYDEPRRFSSVGENVRDAACYVFWAFARAFNEEDLRPLSNLIMTNLLLVALFDREVHCRHAASAAFQEYVGRCCSIPSAIAVMNEADYSSVGTRTNAYLYVSVQIAKIGGFTKAMIEHLVVNRLCHWDAVIRDIAAKALNVLTPFEPLYTASFLPALVENAYSDVLTQRLGATPAIAEIIHGLYTTGDIHDYVDDATLESVKAIIPNYRQNGQFRGMGGDMMKGSCCKYIWKCSEAKLQVNDVAEDWLFVIQECVYNMDPEVRGTAVSAFHSFLENYSSATISDRIVREYVAVLSAVEMDGDFRRACGASVLGNIPKMVFETHLDTIIPALIKCTHISPATTFYTESRCMAVKALLYILTNVDLNNISKETVHEVFWCFLNALEDYTRNKKGDIGSQVRCEAITALFALTKCVLTRRIAFLEADIVEKILPKMMQLALEPQLKICLSAREVFRQLLYSHPELPYIPAVGDLKKIFPREQCTDLDWWKGDLQICPNFIRVLFLMVPQYTPHILLGFIMTIGGVTESSVLSVGTVFFEALEEIPFEQAYDIAKAVVKLLAISYDEEHLSSPTLLFLSRLLVSGAVHSVLLDSGTNFAADVLRHVKKEMRMCKDFNKIRAAISILSELCTVHGEVAIQAFQMLVRYLKHSSLAIRSTAASRMFETFSLLDDAAFPGCDMQLVLKLLSDTKWKGCADDYTDAVSSISEEVAAAKNFRI